MVLFHFRYYGNTLICQAFDTNGAVCKYQSQNNVHKPQTHMTSRADLKRLVKKGFISRTLVNAFGGTVHRQKGYTGDTDFIIQYKEKSDIPAGRYIERVLTHEFEGNLECRIYPTDESHGWEKYLIIIEIRLENSVDSVMRLAISSYYPQRLADGTIRDFSMCISVRLLR